MTKEMIQKRFEARKTDDMFGFEVNEYISYLGFDYAKKNHVLKEEAFNEDQIDETKGMFKSFDEETLLKEMKDYISFAYEKADNERGISANRSIMHYIAWTWLMGDIDFSAEIEKEFDSNYHSYGKPILDMICKQYGWKI